MGWKQVKIAEHADHTEKLYNLRAEDIHKWIDGYFDRDGFTAFMQSGEREGYDPYSHRKFRHCLEALPEAIAEFSGRYSEEQVRQVFECHIKDDYDNYIPGREDFANGRFFEKYHEAEAGREPILTASELVSYFRGKQYRQQNKRKSLLAGFGIRILLPAAAALLLFILSVFLVILPMFHDSLLQERKDMIRDISSLAVTAVAYYRAMEDEGTLTRAEAQRAAADEIRKLRYGPELDNYFWITDLQPMMIMHPWRPELEGTDLSDYTDSMNRSGKRLFVESVELVRREGNGFLQYLWQLSEESDRTVPKLSFVQGIDEWGWIVGTGVFIHDIEEEISRLSRQLIVVFSVISLVLILFIGYLVYQSRIIERNRRQAEAGLNEAKERYRALVEASNEGYLLILNANAVFTNHTFSRMTGYDESDLLNGDIWELLFPGDERSVQLAGHLTNLRSENPSADEFEARLTCRSGSRIDVVIRVSRIYLSEQNGQVISFRQITGNPKVQSIPGNDLLLQRPEQLLEEINASESGSHVVRVLNQLPQTVRSMILAGNDAPGVRMAIRDIYAAAVARFVELAEKELGGASIPYAFLSLGSSGRGELTLFSDQDNAMVFDSDAVGDMLERQRLLFLRIADVVCTWLNNSGFSYCPGGIMAVNPANCLTAAEWKARYAAWVTRSDSLALLDIHVFFDIKCSYGSEKLAGALQRAVFQSIAAKPAFLAHFARNCLQYSVPRGIFGTVKTEERDGREVVNIKECIIPLINFTRLYALREHVAVTATMERAGKLRELGVFDEETFITIERSFETLWELRFVNQILAHGELRKVNDDLLVAGLSDENRRRLREALASVSVLQSRLSYDFLGVDIS